VARAQAPSRSIFRLHWIAVAVVDFTKRSANARSPRMRFGPGFRSVSPAHSLINWIDNPDFSIGQVANPSPVAFRVSPHVAGLLCAAAGFGIRYEIVPKYLRPAAGDAGTQSARYAFGKLRLEGLSRNAKCRALSPTCRDVPSARVRPFRPGLGGQTCQFGL
jgi:hypothetical protein